MKKLRYFCIAILILTLSVTVFASPLKEFKAAAIEFNPAFQQREQNYPAMAEAVKTAVVNGAKLILFPEMSTTGYLYGSRQSIKPYVDTIPGKTTDFFVKLARQYDVYIVVGMPEVDNKTKLYYNAAFLVGPQGLIGKYRKTNLYTLESTWAARGNLGVPVFKTPLGNIAMIICYDDYFYQSARLASLKGANILAFISSSGRMLQAKPKGAGVHVSIAAMQQQALQNGLFVVAANRNNIEKNTKLNVGVHYLGGSTIWNPLGKKLAQAPVSQQGDNPPAKTPPTILYATINPELYENENKKLLTERRPELYQEIALFMAPREVKASSKSHNIHALLVQYAPKFNAVSDNEAKIKKLMTTHVPGDTNLIVFPEYSLTGFSSSITAMQQLAQYAEKIKAFFQEIAKQYASYVVYNTIVEVKQHYYNVAIMLNPAGEVVATYKKTHLNQHEKQWLTAGNDLSVFDTNIGRIGLLIGDETRFPEAADVLSVKRADMIIVPAAWHGQYGKADAIDKSFLVKPYPENTNVIWYATAKNTQAYVLVANLVATKQQYVGSSALYSLDPVNGYYPPEVASKDKEQVFAVNFKTIAPKMWWTSQQIITDGRRPELYVPLLLDPKGECFKVWQESKDFFVGCWR